MQLFAAYDAMAIPTTDQLRDRIDQGATGEKIAAPDPAAAPLGTDAEAGGSPPTASERKLEAASAPQETAEPRQPLPGGVVYLALIAALAIVIVAIVVLAAG
jgi:hypothetical protein